jgi:ketosteroid isomerase-like protein
MNSHDAQKFADHWIDAWNSHDLEQILTHYTDDFELSSPVIVSTMNEPSGRLKGKTAIGKYWSKALAKYPDLRFEKQHVFTGAGSVTLIYKGVLGLSAEVFLFTDQGKVHAAYAHYDL